MIYTAMGLVAVLVIIAVFKIKFIRHGLVLGVWKAIDKIGYISANKAVMPEGIAVTPNIPYIDDGNRGHLLDVYRPPNIDKQLPVIIYIHGGGFVAGDKRHTQQYCMTLAKEGYGVFNINYRLAPEHTILTQIKDVVSAIEWIKENCSRYNVDKGKIIIAGNSAGAYLAGFIAVICSNRKFASLHHISPPLGEDEIKAVLLFSGLFDLETGIKRRFPSIKSDIEMLLGDKMLDSKACFSVINNINENFPPTFITSGEVDGLYPESHQLIMKLQQENVVYKSLFFDIKEKKAFHDYQHRLYLSTAKKCMEEVVSFLKEIII